MPRPQKLRIAIAGCGSLVQQVHLPLLKAMSQVEVVAVADPFAGAGKLVEAKFPGVVVFETLEEVLEKVPCDGVIVASPTHLHAEHGAMVLRQQKALYLEKPIASGFEEAAELVELSRMAGQVAMMGFNYRYNPLWQHVGREAKRQQLTGLETMFTLATRELPAWKQKRATGGGALLDLATHHLDLILSVFDLEPVSVEAAIRSERTEDDSVELKLVSSTGIPIVGTYALLGREADEFTLRTSAGSRRFSRYDALAYPVFPVTDFVRYHLARRVSPWNEVSFARSLRAWVEAIEDKKASPIPLEHGLRVMRWVQAAESSGK